MIDLCTDSINVLGPRHSFVYNNSQYLNESELSISVEFTPRETSLTSLSFRELSKVTKLHLEILGVNRLLENQMETVAKSEFNCFQGQTDQSMSNKSRCHHRKE